MFKILAKRSIIRSSLIFIRQNFDRKNFPEIDIRLAGNQYYNALLAVTRALTVAVYVTVTGARDLKL